MPCYSSVHVYTNALIYYVHIKKLMNTRVQEAESQWSSYSSDQHMSLVKEAFPMTVKGFARACLGDIFENQSELDILAGAYHKCWKFLGG